MRRFDVWFLVCVTCVVPRAASHAGGFAENIAIYLETGVVFTGYNDVRIPGNTGTTFSLSEDLDSDESVFWRARVSYQIGTRHSLSVLVAPLTIEAHGPLEREIAFRDAVFPAGTTLDATYRFDSYRLTYRYGLVRKEGLQIGMGLTAKIRDATISLKSRSSAAEKPNTGFVPLINIRIHWLLKNRLGLLLDGDALAAPQGRAEDLLFAVTYAVTDRLTFRGGYRILEGGADNDEVYTFALFHYLCLGTELRF